MRVDFLYTHWSPKTKALINLLGTLLLLIPFCVMGIYVTVNPVLSSWGLLPNGTWGPWEMSPDPDGLPRAPLKSMIIVAFGTLILQSVAQIIKYIAVLRGSEEVYQELVAEAADQGEIG